MVDLRLCCVKKLDGLTIYFIHQVKNPKPEVNNLSVPAHVIHIGK